MVSALTVLLLGCWLAGRSGVSGEGSYPKPNISVSPGAVIPVGGKVTIQCWLQNLGMRILLYKDGGGNHLTYKDPAGYVAEFPITSARREQSGNYTCRYSHRTGPAAYSEPSDPVQIIVADLSFPQPSISFTPSSGVTLGGAVTVRCRGQRRNMRFVLNKERHHFPPVDSDGCQAEFSISNVRREHGGSYSCSYHSRSEPFTGSYPSDPVELVVRGGTDPTQPGAVLAPISPGSAGPGGLELQAPPGLTSPIIAGVSAAAAGLLLLLLLVAFVCFRKTRARKGAAPRPSSTSPLVVLKAPAQQDPVYASIDEGKEPQTLPQEPDPDGLTYAELNHQALQAKRGGPAPDPEPAQPSVYAAINMSQGGPLQ